MCLSSLSLGKVPLRLVLVVALSIFCVAIVYVLLTKEHYNLATITSSEDYKLSISADISWEATQGIYCEVCKSGEIICKRTYIGGTLSDISGLAFNLVEVQNGAIVALVEATCPQVVLAIFDFSNSECWPRAREEESWKETLERGERLISVLRKETEEIGYVLSNKVSGDVECKVR